MSDGEDESITQTARRAAEVGARPEVQRWIKRLRRLAREMPEDVAVFCETGRPFVLALSATRDANGSRGYETPQGCVDQDAIIESIPRGPKGGGWDGGGW